MNTMTYRRHLILGLVAALAVVGLGVTHAAAEKALLFKDAFCVPFADGSVCYDNFESITVTSTPSGNDTSAGNGWSKYTQFDLAWNLVYANSITFRSHALLFDDVLQESAVSSTLSQTIGGQTCEVQYTFHMVDGEIQFNRGTSCL